MDYPLKRSYFLEIAFYEKSGIEDPKDVKKEVYVVVSSDRGLCGAVHANLVRFIRDVFQCAPSEEKKLIVIGDKAKTMLQRQYSKQFIFTVSDVGKRPLSFSETSLIADAILKLQYPFDKLHILFNKFKSVISSTVTTLPVYTNEHIYYSPNISSYDSMDFDVLQSYLEFHLASVLFYAFRENFTSELASRMNAMEGATKNAGELINTLTLHYNRTRQFVITRELIEIISGAAALKEQKQA